MSGEGITNVTVQWCFITESLDESVHSKGRHGYGSLIRTNGDVTFHHNLYASHRSRSPQPGTYGEGSILLDFRNNVIHRGGRGYTSRDPARLNYVGNYVSDTIPFVATETTVMYVAGNFVRGEKVADGPIVRGLLDTNRRDEPFAVAPVATDEAKVTFDRVLASAGATLPRRDAVDLRIVRQVREGKGGIIDSQDEVGGWPELEASNPPPDHDRDGLPDAWEREHGLDPDDAGDSAGDRDGDGYTNLEELLEGSSLICRAASFCAGGAARTAVAPEGHGRELTTRDRTESLAFRELSALRMASRSRFPCAETRSLPAAASGEARTPTARPQIRGSRGLFVGHPGFFG